MIKIKELSLNYKGLKALDNISLTIEKGETVALLGQNGAGKSSLLKSLTGELTSYSGEIEVVGAVGILPEGGSPIPELKVREYLEYIAYLKGIDKKLVKDVIKSCHLAQKAETLCKTLSKGLSQRVMLAGALIGDPEIIILDEPATGLDPLFQKEILDIINATVKGKIVLFSTHNIHDALSIANRVVVLKDGKVTYDKLRDSNVLCFIRYNGSPKTFPENSTKLEDKCITIIGESYADLVKKGQIWLKKENLELLELKRIDEGVDIYEFL